MYNLLSSFLFISQIAGASSEALTPPKSFTFGIEGPAVDAQGNIYAVNYQRSGTVGKVTPDGKGSIFVELPKGSTGVSIQIASSGDMFIADYKTHTIFKVKSGTQVPEVFVQNKEMYQPNDLTLAKDGTLYASDPNWKKKTGRIWKITPDKKTSISADQLKTPNGIALSRDEKKLYYSDSDERSLYSFDVTADGLKNRKRVVKFKDFSLDGIKVLDNGNILATRITGGTLAEVTPEGKIVQEFKLKGKDPTNLAIAPDGKTVYVTQRDGGFIEKLVLPKAKP